MLDRNLVGVRIREKEAEIQALEERLRDSKVYVQALQDVLGLFPEEEAMTELDGSVLRPGSAMAGARDAILKAGRPMHVDELLGVAGKEPTREAKVSLGSALSSYVRRGEIFTRPAMSTFGLIELQQFSESDSGAAIEPPPGFGNLNNGLATHNGE